MQKNIHQYQCVDSNPFGQSSVVFPMSHALLPVDFTCGDGSSVVRLCAGSCFWQHREQSVPSLVRHLMSPKFKISALQCWIWIKICSSHLEKWSPKKSTISGTETFSSCTFRTFSWFNTWSNLSQKQVGYHGLRQTQTIVLRFCSNEISRLRLEKKYDEQKLQNFLAVGSDAPVSNVSEL